MGFTIETYSVFRWKLTFIPLWTNNHTYSLWSADTQKLGTLNFLTQETREMKFIQRALRNYVLLV